MVVPVHILFFFCPKLGMTRRIRLCRIFGGFFITYMALHRGFVGHWWRGRMLLLAFFSVFLDCLTTIFFPKKSNSHCFFWCFFHKSLELPALTLASMSVMERNFCRNGSLFRNHFCVSLINRVLIFAPLWWKISETVLICRGNWDWKVDYFVSRDALLIALIAQKGY